MNLVCPTCIMGNEEYGSNDRAILLVSYNDVNDFPTNGVVLSGDCVCELCDYVCLRVDWCTKEDVRNHILKFNSGMFNDYRTAISGYIDGYIDGYLYNEFCSEIMHESITIRGYHDCVSGLL